MTGIHQFPEDIRMAKLPIGIQSFEDLRENGYLYVDKSMYIRELSDGGKTFFLSRPRRFGKSLFVTTLEAYFRGRKELFQGLAIGKAEAQKPDEEQWIEYPVMTFYLSGGAYGAEGGLERRLAYSLQMFEEQYGIPHYEFCAEDLRAVLPVWLTYCLQKGYEITGRQVVFLVDEYDKPLLDNLSVDDAQEKANHRLMKDFFSVLKDQDRYLKFVFFTGVTKFSKVSIFSDLNQLKDISLLPKYAAICGITESELDSNFEEEIGALAKAQDLTPGEARARLAQVYDGYHFSDSPVGVYNPFSLLNAFADGRFGRYWFESGTPTFLVRKLEESGIPVQDFTDGVQATEAQLGNYRADDSFTKIAVIPLLYQTGYLTITGYDTEFQEYTLSYPNEEVKYGYLNSLIPAVSPGYGADPGPFSASRIVRCLRSNDLEAVMQMLQALLASIPYHEGKAPADEQQWRNVVYAVFTVLGQYVRTEVHSAGGRSDCIVETDRYIDIFEFKQDKSAQEALQQIDDRRYALPYITDSRKIMKIGANFSTEMKTLDEWKIAQQDEK